MAKKKECCCKHRGCMMLVLGLLVLANAYWAIVNWAVFIGAVLVLKGLLKLAMPNHVCK